MAKADEELGVEEGVTVERIETAPEGDTEIIEDTTLPEIMLNHVQEHGDEVALRWKRYGVWEEYDWGEYYDRVRHITLGLETFGFEEDDILFTIGYNRPHQLWAWLASQILGGMAAPNYEDTLPEGIGDQLELLSPKVAYAEDQEMVDKLLQVADRSPSLEAIIYRDEKGMFRYDDTAVPVISYDEVEQRGKDRAEANEVSTPEFEERIRNLDPQSPAMLPPTSGTTGMPKRVKLSHFNFVNLANAAIEIDPLPEGSDYFSYLPMAWIGEQMILMAAAFLGGWTANFPEEPETESEDLREIGPEIIFSSPGTYESWVAEIKAQIENTSWLKRKFYEKAMDIGQRYAEYVSGDKRDEEPPASLRLKHWLGYWTVYRPILDKVGLKRAKNVYTGGGPLGEEHFQYYHALGVPLKQIWGQSEVCGFVTMHRDDDIQVDTVGEVFPNVTVGITPEGELLVSGPVVTSGYYNQPEKTEEALEGDWLHTDDFGAITEDGHVKVFDRMDDVLELEDGSAIAPISVETKLKFNPYIKEALVVGDGRESLSAILNIRFDNVAEWADQRDIQYAGYQDLTQKEPVLELIRGVVGETNEELDEHKIERFVVLFKEFDADDGEMTRTGKIRREIVTNRYQDLIDGVYAGEETVEMDVTITYQDGRESVEHGEMEVVDVPMDEEAMVSGGGVDG
ncbi:long-chain acyl-CoA synthetase [Halovenus aranensis]|uniref:Long-chain acyl-CoA synthetase n=1 Tax=Halovenus aranensis TaxID=890420 RepID=A0A1G8RVZ0_9EURY|nr:AMP-binding protein [Halovenus aranensis]SDJ21191.1 long-chain acyl-CoA synthetase [Halovenus aranensis]